MDKKTNAFKRFFNSRNLKYGSNSIILIAAVIVIAIFANILVGMTGLKLDLTTNKLFSLTDTTKNLLKQMNKDVTITGLFDDGKIDASSEYKEVTDLLNQYKKYNHIKVQYVDPDKNPGIIKQLDSEGLLGLQKENFVIECGTKKKVLSKNELFTTQTDQQTFQTYRTGSNAEQGFTGAIKFVTADKTPVVYFTEGHNEASVTSDYSSMKTYLERNNYAVQTIKLLTAPKVPDDAALLIVASPKSDLSETEKNSIALYLKNGGKAIFMFDYLSNDPDFTQFNAVLADFNLAVDSDKVKENDDSRRLPDDPYTILLDVTSNSIIPDTFNVVLGNSRSVSILKNAKPYIITTSLMKTSDKAVGEVIDTSKGQNVNGPMDVAVASENQGGGPNGGKVIVMGNANFISDSAQQTYGNMYNNGIQFFLQSMNWMLDKKDDIIVPSKDYSQLQINITGLQSSVMGIVLIVLLPLIILGTGLMVYLRRRHL